MHELTESFMEAGENLLTEAQADHADEVCHVNISHTEAEAFLGHLTPLAARSVVAAICHTKQSHHTL